MKLLSAALAASALIACAVPAHANQITYVAANGNDSRPCTVEANPCLTLTRAIAASQTGGEIRLLSNLPNEIVTIRKSLTIDGNGHTMIGRLVILQFPAVVAIRNLNLTGRGVATNGITVTRAAAVHIENVGVERYTGDGIFIGSFTNTEVTISGSSIHDNNRGIAQGGNGASKLAVHDTRIENNAVNGIIASGSALVTGSVVAGNSSDGISVVDDGSVTVFDTTIASNGNAGLALGVGTLTVFSSVSRANGSVGLFSYSAGRVASAAYSVFTGNAHGVAVQGGGVVQTLRTISFDPDLFTNVIAGNTTSEVTGTLTNVDSR
jgi:hypothetical protein